MAGVESVFLAITAIPAIAAIASAAASLASIGLSSAQFAKGTPKDPLEKQALLQRQITGQRASLTEGGGQNTSLAIGSSLNPESGKRTLLGG